MKKRNLILLAVGIFLLLPIYDNALNLDGDKSPYSSGILAIPAMLWY